MLRSGKRYQFGNRPRSLQLENGPQSPKESGAIFLFRCALIPGNDRILHDVLAFEPAPGEQFTESSQTLRGIPQYLADNILADLEDLAISVRPNTGGARFAG